MPSRGNDAVVIENICILLHLFLDLVNRNFCVLSVKLITGRMKSDLWNIWGLSPVELSSKLESHLQVWKRYHRPLQEACNGSNPTQENVHHLYDQLSRPRPPGGVAHLGERIQDFRVCFYFRKTCKAL